MSTTYSTQAHLYAVNGANDGFQDGDGMSTMFTRDMVADVDNLGGYVDLRVIQVQSVTPAAAGVAADADGTRRAGYVQQQLHTASREIFMCQVPVVLNRDGLRLVWTCGVAAYATGGATAALTAVTVYLSSKPYTGAGATSAFDLTKLAPDYVTRSVTVSPSTITHQYELAIDATTGITPAVASYGLKGEDAVSHLIVTCTGSGTGVQNWARIYDFTAWFLPE